MSCECPNQQQMCDPVRGLPYNPSGIPFIDEEDDANALHAVVVCNDLRSPPEAQGLIPNDDTPPPARRARRLAEKARRGARGPLKANDVRAAGSAGPGGGGGAAGGADRRGSLRRGLRGLANKVRRNSSGAGASSDGRRAGHACGCKSGCGRTAGLSLLLSAAYCLLAVIAAVVTYSLVAHLVDALRYPLRAVKYRQVDTHTAPGRKRPHF